MPASLRSDLFTSRRNGPFTSPESASERGSERDRVEGSIPTAQALYKTHSGRQKQKSNRDGSGPRTTRFHLGHCGENRNAPGSRRRPPENAKKKPSQVKKKAEQMAADGHTKRRILVRSMRYGLPAQPALQDRKSTRLNSSHIQKSRMPSSA